MYDDDIARLPGASPSLILPLEAPPKLLTLCMNFELTEARRINELLV